MKARLVACLFLVIGAAGADTMIMEVVALRHRLIGDVLPTLRELVAPGGTVTGMNNQLIIRSTADNLAQLKEILTTLDTQQRQLRITVRQGIAAHSQWREDQLSARVRAGGVNAGALSTTPVPAAGAEIVVGDDNAQIAYRNLSTRDHDDSANTHFVTALEGTPAFIGAGQVVPLPRQSAVLTPYGAIVQQSLDYQPVGAGVYVTPRLAGDIVHLEISPFADKFDRSGGGQISQHGLSTTASGRLGEWIPLGGTGESFNDAGGGIAYGTRQQSATSYDVEVKVDVMP